MLRVCWRWVHRTSTCKEWFQPEFSTLTPPQRFLDTSSPAKSTLTIFVAQYVFEPSNESTLQFADCTARYQINGISAVPSFLYKALDPSRTSSSMSQGYTVRTVTHLVAWHNASGSTDTAKAPPETANFQLTSHLAVLRVHTAHSNHEHIYRDTVCVVSFRKNLRFVTTILQTELRSGRPRVVFPRVQAPLKRSTIWRLSALTMSYDIRRSICFVARVRHGHGGCCGSYDQA